MSSPAAPPRYTWTLIALAFLLLGTASTRPLDAQSARTGSNPPSIGSAGAVEIGDRVRLTKANDGVQLDGTLVDVSRGWVTLELTSGTLRRTPVEGIATAELHGRQKNFMRHFLMVEIAGTLTGAVASGITWKDEPCAFVCIGPTNRAEAFLWGALGGAVLSLPVAVLVGAVAKRDHWTPATLGEPQTSWADRVQVRVAPAASGMSLGVSLGLGGGS